MKHEEFISAIRDIAITPIPDAGKAKLEQCKLVYGVGRSGIRGITYFDAWRLGKDTRTAFVEICAVGEESPVQLAGTTIHELGHVLAGYGQGHNKVWYEATESLGLRCFRAAGTSYNMAMFQPTLRERIDGLIQQFNAEGPAFSVHGLYTPYQGPIRPCPLGIGTRGGISRGLGSGSRLRLYVCECSKPIKARVASDEFNATCNVCKASFKRG